MVIQRGVRAGLKLYFAGGWKVPPASAVRLAALASFQPAFIVTGSAEGVASDFDEFQIVFFGRKHRTEAGRYCDAHLILRILLYRTARRRRLPNAAVPPSVC